MDRSYKIRLAGKNDLYFLPEIEMRSSQGFPDHVLPRWMWGQTIETEELLRAFANKTLWVAEHNGELVGFAMALPVNDIALLYEVNVAPEELNRGVGTALVAAVVNQAAQNGHKRLWVRTFDNISWAVPFYRRSGFEVIPVDKQPETIRRIMHEEQRSGLSNRVAMAMELGAAGLAPESTQVLKRQRQDQGGRRKSA